MPIYEYRCGGCRKKVSVFQRRLTASAPPLCPECGSADLARLVSQFAFHRGMSDFDDGPDLDESFLDGLDENDPQSIRRLAERMGEDLPPGFDDDLAGMAAGGDEFGGDGVWD